MSRLLCLLSLLFSMLVPALADATDVADAEALTWVLEFGPEEAWPGAINALLKQNKRIPRLAVASVLRRQHVLDPKHRLSLIKQLANARATRDGRVLDFLRAQALYAESKAARAALKGLLRTHNRTVIPMLAELFHHTPEWRRKIGLRLTSFYRAGIEEEVHGPEGGHFYPHEAARLAGQGRQDSLYYEVYRSLAGDSDPSLRFIAADKLRYLADVRTDELLWKLAGDGDAEVRQKALWSLARRRNRLACDVLLESFWGGAKTGADRGDEKHRRSNLADTGEVCGPTHLFRFIELLQSAPREHRDEAEMLVASAVNSELLPLLEDSEFRVRLESARMDSDDFLRGKIDWLLNKFDKNRRQQRSADRPFWLGPVALVLLALVCGLMGLVLFLWGFRLLTLLRLLQGLAPSKVRSAALGTVVLRGRLQPRSNRLLEHPDTGEPCLYFAGADREHPWQRFDLQDNSGRMLVDPRGAVLLSADGVLMPGEKVQILGTVSRQKAIASAELGEKWIHKPPAQRTFLDRIVHFLVQGVLGLWNPAATAKPLFSDPRRCFWIWDDLDHRPMYFKRELGRLVLIFLFAGLWTSVFAAAALTVFDHDFAQFLAVWLNLE